MPDSPAIKATPPRSRRASRERVDPARRAAFDLLRAVSEQDAYANLTLPKLLRDRRISGRDAAFATELSYGTLRARGSYDAILAACIDRPLDQVDGAVLDALRLGAHQVLGMRVPPHAAVAATVELVRAVISQGAAGFANAVLRRVSTRDLEQWFSELVPDDTDTPRSDRGWEVRTAHPTWIVRTLRQALAHRGRPAVELGDLLAADNVPPAVTLALRPGMATAADLGSVESTPGRWAATAAVLSGGVPGEIAAVREGRARVQDEGSQLVALALASAPIASASVGAESWLDLCAGPGGKAALLAALAARQGAEITAVEVLPHRADLVRSALAGTPGTWRVEAADGRDIGGDRPAAYDRVLVDAPCTGLGALRRRPEARWRRTPADLASLGPLQRDLLGSAIAATRSGGVVVYATCSPHLAETSFVVDDVLRKHPRARRIDARTLLPGVEHLGEGPDVQLWPHLHGTDGMFLAAMTA